MSLATPRKGYKSVPWLFGKEIDIPVEWETETLESTCDQIQDMDHKMPEKIDKGIPFLSISDIVNKSEIDFTNQKYISQEDYSKFLKKLQPKKNDLLYSRVATIGESRIIREEKRFAFTYNVVLIKTGKKITSLFLKYALDFPIIKNRVKSIAPQGAYPFLGLGDIKKIPIILPTLPEQQKIATMLSNVDNLIESTGKVITHSKKVKTGLMQKLLTRGIGHTKFKDTYLKYRFLKILIPEEYMIKSVKQISNSNNNAVKTGPFGLMLHSSDYVSQGTPLILVKNIQRGNIVDHNIPKISDKDVERLSDYKVKEGDMIFTRVGRVGSSALVEKIHVGWLFSGQTLRIRFENPELNSKYVHYYFQSELFARLLIPELLGSTRDSINTKILEEIPIIIPPKIEQDKIVIILSNVDSKIDLQVQYKEKLEKLKKSLMQKLLTGEVRV